MDVILGIDQGPQPRAREGTPTFEILYRPWGNEVNLAFARLDWSNIEHWGKKLSFLARKGLQAELERACQGKRKADALLREFCRSSNARRLQIACDLAGVESPARVGKMDPAWGAQYSVWKTLVWHYKICRSVGNNISSRQIAEDRWLCRLLDLPVRDDDIPQSEFARIEKRSKRLWFWFKDLEAHGILSYAGRRYFAVLKAPADFRPWVYLNTQ